MLLKALWVGRGGAVVHSPDSQATLRGRFTWMEVVPDRRVILPPPTLGKQTLHSFYLTLTACVYMAHFTLASGHLFCEVRQLFSM